MTSLAERARDRAQDVGRGAESRTMTIGDFLVRRLQEAGIGHVFGVPGAVGGCAVPATAGPGSPYFMNCALPRA